MNIKFRQYLRLTCVHIIFYRFFGHQNVGFIIQDDSHINYLLIEVYFLDKPLGLKCVPANWLADQN